MLEAQFLGDFGFIIDRERRRVGRIEDFDVAAEDFYVAGGEFGIAGVFRARDDFAVNADDELERTCFALASSASAPRALSMTTWQIPLRSRRSMKTRSPKSRCFCTQPARETRSPTFVLRKLPAGMRFIGLRDEG
jgi:hypothetical protein